MWTGSDFQQLYMKLQPSEAFHRCCLPLEAVMPWAAQALTQHELSGCFTLLSREQPHCPSCISFALAKAFVLCRELIQLKNNTGKKMSGYLLPGWVLLGLYEPGRGQSAVGDHGKRGARFSLPAAAAALINTQCKWLLNYRFSVWKYCPQEA